MNLLTKFNFIVHIWISKHFFNIFHHFSSSTKNFVSNPYYAKNSQFLLGALIFYLNFYLVRLSSRTNFRYTNLCRKFYERRLFFLPEVRPMVNILQKGFNHVGLRKHSLMLLFGTFVLALLTYIDHHKK